MTRIAGIYQIKINQSYRDILAAQSEDPSEKLQTKRGRNHSDQPVCVGGYQSKGMPHFVDLMDGSKLSIIEFPMARRRD